MVFRKNINKFNNRKPSLSLRLDHVYFDKKKNKMMCVLVQKGHRHPWVVSILEILQKRTIIDQLNPIDAFLLGVFSSMNNKKTQIDYIHLCKIKKHINLQRAKKYECLKITKKQYTYKSIQVTFTNFPTKNELTIDLCNLENNLDIVSLIPPCEALSLAFDFNELACTV